MHCESPADQDQLTVMKDNLIQRDAESGKQLRVFIETPARLCNFFIQPKVTTHLRDALEEASLSRTEIQDVEIRCVSGAANYILQPELDPHTISSGLEYNAQKSHCTIDEVTFKSLEEEFSRYINHLQEAQKGYSNHAVQEIFTEKLEYAQSEYNALKNDIKTYKIDLDDTILEVSKRLYANRPADEDDPRQLLFQRILHIFEPLFELYIFHQILISREISEIVVIAGSWHIQSIRSMLRGIRAKLIVSHEGANAACLEKKYLDFFEDQWDCWNGCSIV